MKHLQLMRTRLAALRSEHGATDPILVIAAIAVSLVLLVGGSFAVAGIIDNGKNLNAKSDLDKVAVAETAYAAENDGYIAYNSVSDKALEKSGVGFTPTDGGSIVVILGGDPSTGAAWIAVSKSTASGNPVYVRSSESSKIVDYYTTGTTVNTTALNSIGLSAGDLTALATAVGSL